MCSLQRNQYVYLNPQPRYYRAATPPAYYYSQMMPVTAVAHGYAAVLGVPNRLQNQYRVPLRSYAQVALASPNQYYAGVAPKY